MTRRYTEDEALATVTLLTRRRLTAFVNARVITPTQSDAGPVYYQLDIARIELLCDLTEDFGLDEDALTIVMSLIDQLHGARADLQALAEAIAQEQPEVRARLGAALLGRRLPPADTQ